METTIKEESNKAKKVEKVNMFTIIQTPTKGSSKAIRKTALGRCHTVLRKLHMKGSSEMIRRLDSVNDTSLEILMDGMKDR